MTIFTKVSCKCIKDNLTRDEKKAVVTRFTESAKNLHCKGVNELPAKTVDFMQGYLSNVIAKNTLKDVIAKNDYIKDNVILQAKYDKAINKQFINGQAQLNGSIKALCTLFISGNGSHFNESCRDLFNFDYDFYQAYIGLFGTVASKSDFTLSAQSVALFKRNLLTLIYAIIKKSGYELDTKKLDYKINNVVSAFVYVNKSEMYNGDIINDLALKFNCYDSNDYIKTVNNVNKLYKNGTILILDEDELAIHEALLEDETENN